MSVFYNCNLLSLLYEYTLNIETKLPIEIASAFFFSFGMDKTLDLMWK